MEARVVFSWPFLTLGTSGVLLLLPPTDITEPFPKDNLHVLDKE